MKPLAILAALGLVLAAAPVLGQMPGVDPQALWTYFTQQSPYQKWGQWPDFAGRQPGKSPHGDFVAVYVNPIALEAKGVPLPAGSLIVKDGFNAAGQLTSITVMYKVPGYNPAGGDWFWARYSPQGQAGPFGQPRGCVGCHGAGAANDHVLAHRYR